MSQEKGNGFRLDWRGDLVEADAERLMAEAWTQVGLAVEGEAKKALYKGRGVVTGTLRRSIHTAAPGYVWSGDNVEPSSTSPERGGKGAAPLVKNGKLTLQVGSGMEYALWIELGGDGSFLGYKYLRGGLEKVKPKIPEILKRFFDKRFKKGTK